MPGNRPHSGIEIQGIVTEILAKTVIPVDHAGHSIKAETVQMIFFHPELAVGKQEIFNLVLAVIETSGTPRWMMALRSLIEVQVIAPVKS